MMVTLSWSSVLFALDEFPVLTEPFILRAIELPEGCWAVGIAWLSVPGDLVSQEPSAPE